MTTDDNLVTALQLETRGYHGNPLTFCWSGHGGGAAGPGHVGSPEPVT